MALTVSVLFELWFTRAVLFEKRCQLIEARGVAVAVVAVDQILTNQDVSDSVMSARSERGFSARWISAMTAVFGRARRGKRMGALAESQRKDFRCLPCRSRRGSRSLPDRRPALVLRISDPLPGGSAHLCAENSVREEWVRLSCYYVDQTGGGRARWLIK